MKETTIKDKLIEWYTILNTSENDGLDAGIVRDEIFDWISVVNPKGERISEGRSKNG